MNVLPVELAGTVACAYTCWVLGSDPPSASVVTAAVAVLTFAPQRAVIVYVLVEGTVTEREPGEATPPMPWSISTDSAFVTAPQFKVDVPPGITVVGDAVNEAMFGTPLQLDDPGALTVTVTVAVLLVDPQRAVSVYVVVPAGLTEREPGVSTPPMP